MKRIIFSVLLLLLSTTTFGQGNPKEISAKADFIVGLSDNAEWTSGGGPSAGGPVVIYVVGETPLLPKMKEFASERSGSGTKYEVKQVAVTDNLADCHILYIASSELAMLAKVLKKVDGTSTLTISDTKDFARYGVMINFTDDEKDPAKVEVNKLVLDGAGIKLKDELKKKVATI